MQLGEKIKLLRKKNGMRQRDVAELLGCDVRTMRQYERNKNSIKHKFIEKMSWEFDVDSRAFNSYKEFDNIYKIAIYNNRAGVEFPKSVVGILELMSKKMLKNRKKVLCLNLGTTRFDEIKELIGSWDNIKKITIFDTELEIFVKDNIEIVSFKSIQDLYRKDPDKCFIEEKLLRTLIKRESNYGMIIGFNECIRNFTRLAVDPEVFNAHLLDKYLSLCDKIIIPILDLYTIKQLNYTLERFSKIQDNETEIFILKNEDELIEDKDKNLEELKHKESKDHEMDNDIKSVIKKNKNLHIKCLNTIIPTWKKTTEVISYFECNSIEYLKKAFLGACSEMNLI